MHAERAEAEANVVLPVRSGLSAACQAASAAQSSVSGATPDDTSPPGAQGGTARSAERTEAERDCTAALAQAMCAEALRQSGLAAVAAFARDAAVARAGALEDALCATNDELVSAAAAGDAARARADALEAALSAADGQLVSATAACDAARARAHKADAQLARARAEAAAATAALGNLNEALARTLADLRDAREQLGALVRAAQPCWPPCLAPSCILGIAERWSHPAGPVTACVTWHPPPPCLLHALIHVARLWPGRLVDRGRPEHRRCRGRPGRCEPVGG